MAILESSSVTQSGKLSTKTCLALKTGEGQVIQEKGIQPDIQSKNGENQFDASDLKTPEAAQIKKDRTLSLLFKR